MIFKSDNSRAYKEVGGETSDCGKPVSNHWENFARCHNKLIEQKLAE